LRATSPGIARNPAAAARDPRSVARDLRWDRPRPSHGSGATAARSSAILREIPRDPRSVGTDPVTVASVLQSPAMKHAADAILRPEQAAYLDALHALSVRGLAAMARTAAKTGRDPLLTKMEARAAARGYPISDPEVACFLAIVARLARPKLVVELGTNIGYGAIVMARAAGEGARVVTIEKSDDLADEALTFIAEAGLSSRIEVVRGEAIPELARIASPIDMVYIDCVKEEYERYLEIAAPKLSPYGVIVADNVLWGGAVALQPPPADERERALALRAFNEKLVSHGDLCGVVLPFGDGVAFAARV
jgi:predicted O-methyltransferase YrrM